MNMSTFYESHADGETYLASTLCVLDAVQGFRDTRKFCDITLVCGGRSFYAHACVLAAASPYFMGLLRSGMSEVATRSIKVELAALSHVTSVSMDAVIDFLYGVDIMVNMENVLELLAVADYFLLSDLKTDLAIYLGEQLGKTIKGCTDVCIECWRVAQTYGCKALYEISFAYILTRFYELSIASSFCELTVNELGDILDNDDLAANGSEVLTAILKWVNHARGTREDVLSMLLEYVKCDDSIARNGITEILTEHGFGHISMPDEMEVCTSSDDEQDTQTGRQVVVAFGDKTSLCYVPLLKEWCHIEPLPEPRKSFKTTVLNGVVYVIGGLVNAKFARKLWCYNPERNQWDERAPMLKTASNFAVACVNGYLYAVGGPKKVVQKYDPKGDYWCFVKPIQTQRSEHCAVAFQNKYLCLIGGYTPETSSLYSVERYHTVTDSWEEMPNLNIGRIESSAVALKDKIFVVGGYGGAEHHEISSCEVYDSLSNVWSLIESMVIPRCCPGIAVLAGKVYVFAGSSHKKCSVEYFCEEQQCWVEIDTKTQTDRKLQCCTVTLSGQAICRNLLSKLD